ncbi:DUF222 domain-containing protein [Georgenia sp. M64]|uniref:HNH endonuclease signature motif containing protein n=1 Tax=Georgenia sp. M64 TaxID=3120520 RepID=UPI0030E54C4B
MDQDPESAARDRDGSAGDDRPADTHTRDGDARAAQGSDADDRDAQARERGYCCYADALTNGGCEHLIAVQRQWRTEERIARARTLTTLGIKGLADQAHDGHRWSQDVFDQLLGPGGYQAVAEPLTPPATDSEDSAGDGDGDEDEDAARVRRRRRLDRPIAEVIAQVYAEHAATLGVALNVLASMAPGPELAALLDEIDLDALAPFAKVEVVAAYKRLESWSAGRAALAAAHVATEPVMYAKTGAAAPKTIDGTAEELALRLATTRQDAAKLVATGQGLTRSFAATRAHLESGQIDYRKAATIVATLHHSPTPVAWMVEHDILTEADRRTHPQLVRDLADKLIAVDPHDAQARHHRARARRHVTHTQPLPDGMGRISAVTTATSCVQIDLVLDHMAQSARAAGDTRTTDQLRADILLALITGRFRPTTHTPGHDHDHAEGDADAATNSDPDADADAATAADTDADADADADTAAGPRTEADAGTGAVESGTTCRCPAAPQDPSEGPCLPPLHLLIPADGEWFGDPPKVDIRLDVPLSVLLPPATATPPTTTTQQPPPTSGPPQDAPTVPGQPPDDTAESPPTSDPPTSDPPQDGPTSDQPQDTPTSDPPQDTPAVPGEFPDDPPAGVATLTGYGPITPDVARALAAGGTWRRIVTDPLTGAVLDVGRTRYRPPADLLDHVRQRDRTCVRPGCTTPAHRCQYDHTQAWAHGGPTAAHNGGPLCTRDHTIKTAGIFTVVQPQPGIFEWLTPTGHAYRREINGTITMLPHTPPHLADRRPTTKHLTGAAPGDPPPDPGTPPY